MSTSSSISTPSLIQKMTGWLPSVPRPSMQMVKSSWNTCAESSMQMAKSCWSTCAGSFQSIKDRFQSAPKPLVDRKVTEITPSVPKKIIPRAQPSNTRRNLLLVAGTVALACATSGPLALAALGAAAIPAVSAATINLNPTELVPFKFSASIWDYSPPTFGRANVPKTPSIAPGIDLDMIQLDLPAPSSFPTPNTGSQASSPDGQADYMASTVNPNVEIYSTDRVKQSKGYLTTGLMNPKLITRGNKLLVFGQGTLGKIYDISSQYTFNPNPINQALNSTIVTHAAEISGDEKVGSLTDNGFFTVDKNFNVAGPLPINGNSASVMTGSDSCYYTSTTTPGEIVCISATTATPTEVGSRLTVSGNIKSIQYLWSNYYERGFLYVGTTTNLAVIPLFANGAMGSPTYFSAYNTIAAMLPRRNNQILDFTSTFAAGLNKLDISNISNPRLHSSMTGLVSSQVGPGATLVAVKDGNLVAKSALGTYIVPDEDIYTVAGTPPGGSAGPHVASVPIKNQNGDTIGTLDFSFTYNPAITVGAPIPRIYAVANKALSVFISQNSFNHVLNSERRYSLTCPSGSRVPSWIKQIPLITGEISGTAKEVDKEDTTCQIYATDSAGATPIPTSARFTVLLPLYQVLNQIATVGERYTFDFNIIGQNSSIPLVVTPSNFPIQFNNNNGIVSGVPKDNDFGPRTITLTITDTDGIPVTTDSFSLTVNRPSAPTILPYSPPSSFVIGSPFSFKGPQAKNDESPGVPITPSSTLDDGSPLSDWKVSYDGKDFYVDIQTKNVFSTTFTSPTVRIVCRFSSNFSIGELHSSSINFAVPVSGTGLGDLLLFRVAAPVLALLGAIWGIRKVMRNKSFIRIECCTSNINAIKDLFKRYCCFCSWCNPNSCDPIQFYDNKSDDVKTFAIGGRYERVLDANYDDVVEHKMSYTVEVPQKGKPQEPAKTKRQYAPQRGKPPEFAKIIRHGTDKAKLVVESFPEEELVGVKDITFTIKDVNDFIVNEIILTRSEEIAPPPPAPEHDSAVVIEMSSPTSNTHLVDEKNKSAV